MNLDEFSLIQNQLDVIFEYVCIYIYVYTYVYIYVYIYIYMAFFGKGVHHIGHVGMSIYRSPPAMSLGVQTLWLLMIIGDYTTQDVGDRNNPIEESL